METRVTVPFGFLMLFAHLTVSLFTPSRLVPVRLVSLRHSRLRRPNRVYDVMGQ